MPGSGAAGGIGWAAMQVLNAEPNPGFDLIAEAVRLDHAIARANVVFTGEGRLDGQTMSGKTVRRVVERASKSDVPVVIFAGSLGPGWENIKALGNVEVIVTTPDGTETAEALENCEENLRSAVWNYVSRS